MVGWLAKLFGGGGKTIVESVGGVLDNLITNKEELAKVKLEVEKEVNRHMEAMQADATKQIEIEVKDRDSARSRETVFVTATGHVDYLQWFLAIAGVLIFGGMVWAALKGMVPSEHENLIHNIFGIIEGILLSIYSYYFGSSAGSRIKDMKK